MKIALLGYGKEGQAAEKYFAKFGAEFEVFENFTDEEIRQKDFSGFDLILRSPSVRPHDGWSTLTQYFFDHCPCPIIGVTGTKGKGTTCSIIKAILDAMGAKAYLVGNIGIPAIGVLDELTPENVVVFEMSSFQLWDLEKSPDIAVVVRVEQDHLDRHYDLDDYINAKSHIAAYQKPGDVCVYYKNNPVSTRIAQLSPGEKIAYPSDNEAVRTLAEAITIPGAHNQENASAAIAAVAAYYKKPTAEFADQYADVIRQALTSFKSLPHRIEFVRELNNVKYYDDNYSATYPAMDVAVKAFNEYPTILIAGGKDRGLDLANNQKVIFESPNIKKAILIGETREILAQGQAKDAYVFADDLATAVQIARAEAERFGVPAIVLMSPGAASFDMFKNFSERGDMFQKYVKELQ